MNTYILNTLSTGLATIKMLEQYLDIDGIIGLSQRNASDAISGYIYMYPYCLDRKTSFVEVEDYSLLSNHDRDILLQLEIDILVVLGWQRLVPQWLIDHCGICAIGIHGSSSGITGGRGRSPQTWALLLGKEEFTLSVFCLTEGIDSGPIIDSRTFPIQQSDDIKISYYKVGMLTAEMIFEWVRSESPPPSEQDTRDSDARYLPQRRPEDGGIDWNRTSEAIHNFIRALTRPYPGAYTTVAGHQIHIWEGRPFDLGHFNQKFIPGTIVQVFPNGDILVKSSDSFFLVEEYSVSGSPGEFTLEEGLIFESTNFREQCQTIVARHFQRYPELTLSDDVLDQI